MLWIIAFSLGLALGLIYFGLGLRVMWEGDVMDAVPLCYIGGSCVIVTGLPLAALLSGGL